MATPESSAADNTSINLISYNSSCVAGERTVVFRPPGEMTSDKSPLGKLIPGHNHLPSNNILEDKPNSAAEKGLVTLGSSVVHGTHAQGT